jgi:hypothetical protein
MLMQARAAYDCDALPLALPAHYVAVSGIVVTGSNPENADFDNPRGEEFGLASYVIAEWADGSRRRSPSVAVDANEQVAMAPAERLAAALNARLANYTKAHPQIAAWGWEQPGYGSDAYLVAQEMGDLGPENY